MTPQDLVGPDQARKLLGLSRTTFWRWRTAGRVPQPVTTISNVPLFVRDEILAAAKAPLGEIELIPAKENA
jgi:predicted DNA-binding transcriptional regulator AlpA